MDVTDFFEPIRPVIDALNTFVWSTPETLPWLCVLLLGTGVFLTVRMGFLQFRKLGHAIRIVKGDFDDPDDEGDISHFQALSTALSATVGIGNIAGVAFAIHYGGPGAIFWMWMTALFGMCTKYTEVTLAMKHRDFDEAGNASGGPQKYILKGLGAQWKPLAAFFAVCAILSSLCAGNMNQINTLADAVNTDFGIPFWVTGVVAAGLVGAVILGGIQRIGKVTAVLMPGMAIIYTLGAVTVLLMNFGEVPWAFGEIIGNAFNPSAGVCGTAAGVWSYTFLWGVKRGLFSNEAGQGSAPIAHAAAKGEHPLQEGLVALLEPFIDTILICTMTALVIVIGGKWNVPEDAELALAHKDLSVWSWEAGRDVSLESFGELMGRRDADATIEKAGYAGDPKDGTSEDEEAVDEVLVIENGLPKTVRHADGTETGAVLSMYDGPVMLDGETGRILKGDAPWSGELKVNGGSIIVEGEAEELRFKGKIIYTGQGLTSLSFTRSLGETGGFIVTLTVILFALSTAISWSYYGNRCAEFLFGMKGVRVYRLVFLVFVFLGATLPVKAVWDLGDLALGLMTIPNLIAVLFLSRQVREIQDEYFSQTHTPKK